MFVKYCIAGEIDSHRKFLTPSYAVSYAAQLLPHAATCPKLAVAGATFLHTRHPQLVSYAVLVFPYAAAFRTQN